MPYSWSELRSMLKRDLIAKHDVLITDVLKPTHLDIFRHEILDELRHREIAGFTKAMVWMTVVITLATIANVILWALK